MCDPISIAGVALSGAGMAANSIAANQVSNATNAAVQQEQQLNEIQRQRANAANQRAAGEYKGFEAGRAAMGAKLGDVLQSAVDRPAPPSAMAPAGAATSTAFAQGAPAVQAYGDQQAHALGNVRSFGDYLAQTNQGAVRAQVPAIQAGDAMKGNAGVLGLQLNDASHVGDTTALLGGIGTGLGGLGVRAGLLQNARRGPDVGLGSAVGLQSKFGNLFASD